MDLEARFSSILLSYKASEWISFDILQLNWNSWRMASTVSGTEAQFEISGKPSDYGSYGDRCNPRRRFSLACVIYKKIS
jgi:hypothetical protein